ncbi:MAG TPA: hypothetical protein VJL78_05565 [Candidatus Nitrosocosmicus sp.]|nr:hypothetical protein [Candidatus Nitrosocosmicus sp.]
MSFVFAFLVVIETLSLGTQRSYKLASAGGSQHNDDYIDGNLHLKLLHRFKV